MAKEFAETAHNALRGLAFVAVDGARVSVSAVGELPRVLRPRIEARRQKARDAEICSHPKWEKNSRRQHALSRGEVK